jgi:hypothetical protein
MQSRMNAIRRIETTGRESIPKVLETRYPRRRRDVSWRLKSPFAAGIDQEKKSTFALAMSYIDPTILMAPLALRSLSTGLPLRMLSMVSSTFLRATAST